MVGSSVLSARLAIQGAVAREDFVMAAKYSYFWCVSGYA